MSGRQIARIMEDNPVETHDNKNNRESILAQLKYPLVFFGLALVAIETAFGVALKFNQENQLISIFIVNWMGFLFLVSVAIVGFITYKAPNHIMLSPQENTSGNLQEMEKLIARLERVNQLLRMFALYALRKPEDFKEALDKIGFELVE